MVYSKFSPNYLKVEFFFAVSKLLSSTVGSNDTACTKVELHIAPKDLTEMVVCQIVSTRCLQLECKFRSSLDDRSSHCNSFANTTFISIATIIGDLQRFR